jgi:hypothetical protein
MYIINRSLIYGAVWDTPHSISIATKTVALSLKNNSLRTKRG